MTKNKNITVNEFVSKIDKKYQHLAYALLRSRFFLDWFRGDK